MRYTKLLTVVDAPAGQTVEVNVEVAVATFVTVEVLPVTVIVLLAVTVLLFVAIMSTRSPQVTVAG